MTQSIPKYFTFFVCLLSFQSLFAQNDTTDPVADLKPPRNKTELFHDNVDKQQKEILRSDGKADNEFTPSKDNQVNFLLTRVVAPKGAIDWLQYRIEKDTTLGTQAKVKYLRGLENVLKYFSSNWKRGGVNAVQLGTIVDGYEKCMNRDKAGLAFDDIVDNLPYDVGLCILTPNTSTFDKNPGYANSQNVLIRKYCELYPERVFLKLRDNTNVPFLDSLVKVAGYRSPGQLYDFASANNRLAYAIRKVDDPLVKAVSTMATSNSGRWYFPFLDDIMKGKMTIGDIDEAKNDSVKYFRLLVRTHLDYVQRAMNKDTAYGYRELESQIEKKSIEVFVNTINGLHELDDLKVRFKIIQPLSAEELYYLAVTTDGEIYTSSFVKGVYPLMMSKANRRGDSLLMLVKFDRFRKFIKMAAGYNTLSDFLSTFPKAKNDQEEDYAKTLMKAFVNGLEKSPGLEDGVDVADSYASIVETNKDIAKEMLSNVRANYQRNLISNNKRGVVMYDLLNKLFLSADSSKHIDLSKEFGIPPVYNVPFKDLVSDSGRVIVQMFFYNDKGVPSLIQGFVKMFSNKNWKIISNAQWITVSSVKGKPVTIYANKAIAEEDGSDETMQRALNTYLEKNDIHPTVTIHRGHSYTAPYTIEQMSRVSRIVFLGSCGGYQIIHDVLQNAPDAHIIASKQIGKTAVNQPFLNLLMEKVRNGNNIDWIPFWEELEKKVKTEGFEDYIPPYKNLGAIFIKAYKKAMGEEEN